MIKVIKCNARAMYFLVRYRRLHVKSLVVKSPGTYPIQFRHDPILFRKPVACLVTDVTKYDKCFPSKWVNCIRYQIYFNTLTKRIIIIIILEKKRIYSADVKVTPARHTSISRDIIFISFTRYCIVEYAPNNRAISLAGRPSKESFNERQETRFVKPLLTVGRFTQRERESVVAGERECLAPNTKHKRNYYYARYSYILFKAFGRTAAATAGGDYYLIELIRSNQRTMSYERVVLRHPLSANRRNTARQEPLSSYRTSCTV